MWNNYEEYNKYLASLKIKATRAGFKKYNSFMKKYNMYQIEYKYLLLNIKPVFIRVYYISVKNTDSNLNFYDMWVNLWLKEREFTLNYLLQNNNNLKVIPSLPEPSDLPGLPNNWQISKEIRSISLTVLNIEPIFNLSILKLIRSDNSKYIEWSIIILNNMKLELENINTYDGFVTSTNIFTSKYPNINEVANNILTYDRWKNLSAFDKVKCYKWICYIILLQMLDKCNELLAVLAEVNITIDDENYHIWIDLKSQLNVIKFWAYNLLDNSIKQHLNRKRIRVREEIITGFDTEYIAENWGKNRLLSAQASITSYIKIEVPINKEFVFEGVDTLLAQTYIKSPPKFLDAEKLRLWVNDILIRNRQYTFGNHDIEMKKVIKYLTLIRGSFESIVIEDNKVTFVTHKNVISNIFMHAGGKELLINMETLLYLINKTQSNDKILNTILNLIERGRKNKKGNISLCEGKYTKPWDSKTLKQKVLLEYLINPKNNELFSANAKNEGEQEFKNIFAAKDITFTKANYIYGHYNSADLSLINNWKELVKAEKIDILKKSFCSSIKYMQVGNYKVYFRDTILLASAVAGTLEAVGKMHGLNKVKLDTKWLYQMDKLFAEDRKLFIDYAMNDSLITLIHALFMNEFSINQGGKGNPLTLGSLANKYLLNKWKLDGYKGYQVDVNFPLGDAQTTITPKGISSLGNTARCLPNFIGSFRGGRNECLSYGKDSGTIWYDYDLTSCYSTIMSMLEDLDYSNFIPIVNNEEAGKKAESLMRESISKTEKTPLSFKEFVDAEVNSGNVYDDVFAGDRYKVYLRNFNKNDKYFKFSSTSTGVEKSPADLIYMPSSTLSRAGKNPSDKINPGDLLEQEQESTELIELSKIAPDVLSLAGNPDYQKSTMINNDSDLSKIDFMNAYSAVKVIFKFPENIKFPPIPVALDQNITIYPLQGKSLITGLEYLSASNILNLALVNLAVDLKDLEHLKRNFYVKIIDGSVIPFSASYSPFFNVIKELQANRRMHPKKSALERIYKDLGNMLYGKTVSGIGNKRVFNSRHELILPTKGGTLSNPIIGGWITAFVRSLLAEVLYVVDQLGGNVCSVTTDGFVTDIENLEQKILDFQDKNNVKNSFLQKYRNIRKLLSNDPSALEIKTRVRGLIQWKTRNQLSVDHTDPALNNYQIPIAAMTGYQKSKNINENIEIVENVLAKGNKILYLNKTLTGALDSFLRDSDVSMITSLRKFRTIFDSRRIIIPAYSKDSMNFSRPFVNIDEAYLHRNLMNNFVSSVYSSAYTHKLVYTSKTVQEELLKTIIRSICEYLNWDLNYDKKRNIAWIMINLYKKDNHAVLSKIYIQNKFIYIFNIINDILANKGKIITPFPVSTITKEILTKFVYLAKENTLNWLSNPSFISFIERKFNDHIIKPNLSIIPFVPIIPKLSIVPFVSPSDKYLEVLEKYLDFAKFMNNTIYNYTYIHPNITKFLISALVSPPSTAAVPLPEINLDQRLDLSLIPIPKNTVVLDIFGNTTRINNRTGFTIPDLPHIIYLPAPFMFA